MITIADLMKICLEFDQQQLTSRPSPWGIVAERLAIVCEHAEASLRDDKILGDWRAVDLSPVRKGVSRDAAIDANRETGTQVIALTSSEIRELRWCVAVATDEHGESAEMKSIGEKLAALRLDAGLED